VDRRNLAGASGRRCEHCDLPDESTEIAATDLFEDVQVRCYAWETTSTADEYIALLETFSGHIAMEDAKRERLYREIRACLT
jgi:hypothetical protein